MKTQLTLAAIGAALTISAATQADVLAYWSQNSNDLPGGGFGFLADPDAFPQAADAGFGFLTVGGGIINETSTNGNGDLIYTWIPSFAGTTLNALDGFPAGGSISVQGGTDTGNNGAWLQFETSTVGYQDVIFSFAARGTSTGFNNNQLSYSFDGIDFINFGDAFNNSATSFSVFEFDFGSLLDDQSTVFVRITLDGATTSTGNNRFDNIRFDATLIPAPGAIALLGLAGIVGATRRRRA